MSVGRRLKEMRRDPRAIFGITLVVLVLTILYIKADVGRMIGLKHSGRVAGVQDDDDDDTTQSSLYDDGDDDKNDKDDDEDDEEDDDDDEKDDEKADDAEHEQVPEAGEGDVKLKRSPAADTECDTECQEFRQMMKDWPAGKPRAVIYYLIQRSSLKILDKSLRSVDHNFNAKYKYPFVVFIEENMNTAEDRRKVKAMTTSPLYIQVVHFDIPNFLNRSAVPRMAGFGARKRNIGYRHMCRFHAGGVYEQPLLKTPGLQYGWRLDDDSQLRKPIDYDIFAYMRDHGYQYGYHKINEGWSPVDFALWDAVERYINETGLKPTFYRSWPKNAARYFNNFEISDLSVWTSKPYRDYFSFVDRLGGIYYYKWGDAAIKTIAVSLFIPRDKTHLFSDVAYAHI